MALTITDKLMRSDMTPHTAELHHFEAGDAWRVSWLPQRLMDRDAAITAMTLADLVSADGGIGLADDPRWPEVDDLAAELGLPGPNAVVHASEPPAGGQPGSGARTAGAVLCAHADDDGCGGHWLAPGQRCDTDREAGTVSDVSQLPGSARNAQALARQASQGRAPAPAPGRGPRRAGGHRRARGWLDPHGR